MFGRRFAAKMAAATGLWCAVAALSACGGAMAPATTIFATAPTSIGAHLLGRPFDATFQPIVGPEGEALFDNDQEHLVRTNVDAFKVSSVVIEDVRELAANATAWGIGSASISAGMEERYATSRAYQVAYVLEVDDTQSMRSASDESVYYLARIYYGHLYEAVVHVDASHFQAGVLADFCTASGRLDAWEQSNRVRATCQGRGMAPRNGAAIFAQNPEEVETAYSTDGPPVPIFADYRTIPRAAAPIAPTAIVAPPSYPFTVRYTTMRIVEDGTWGTSTWHVAPWCTVAGQEIRTSSPGWDSTEVNTGATYPVNLVQGVNVSVGNVIECGTRGREAEDNVDLAPGSFTFTVTNGTVGTTGTFTGANGDTSYVISYEVLPGR